jgi:hypothetical protein
MGAQTQGDPETDPQGDPRGAERRVLPFSCSTNLSNDVLEGMRRVKLRADAYAVCLYMHRQTFGNAGFHKKRHRSEVWCDFRLSEWAREVPCDKGNLSRIIKRLEECRIIVWQGNDRASGRIGWNVDTTLWQRYGAPGGARPGAGRPRKFNTTTPSESTEAPFANQYDNENNSIRQRKQFNTTTITGQQPASIQARGGAEEREETEETLLRNGRAAPAASPSVPSPLPSPLPAPLPADVTPQDPDPTPAPPIARRPPRGKRKLSDEQLATHNAKAQYIRLLISAIEAKFGDQLPTPERQRAWAEWFYLRREGAAPIEDVVACWEATLPDPYFAAAPPTMAQLQGRYAMWIKGREGYTKAMLAKAARTAAVDQGGRGARAAPGPSQYAPASEYRRT